MDFVNGQIERWRRTWTTGDTGLILGVFTATLFLSALLLFSVQPMFAKMVLPQARRLAVGVGGVDVLLPGGAAGRLLLRACAQPLSRRALDRPLVHLAVLARRRAGAADRPAGESRPSRRRAMPTLADRHAGARRRPAVFRGLGQRAAAAGLVRPHRPSARQRPLLPLWRLQPRQPASRCSPIRSRSSRSPASRAQATSGPRLRGARPR